MKKIPLSRGLEAIVDDADFDRLSKYKWYASSTKNKRACYALRHDRTDGDRVVQMHRDVLCLARGMYVDHVDGNGLNNRRANLRPSTPSQNSRNRFAHRDGRSKYKGVSKTRRFEKSWRAQIWSGHRNISLGSFGSEVEAAKAYDAAARELYGEFARLNFGDDR